MLLINFIENPIHICIVQYDILANICLNFRVCMICIAVKKCIRKSSILRLQKWGHLNFL